MQPLISVLRRCSYVAVLVALPALVWAQASEGAGKKLEVQWQFDTGG